MPNDDPTYLVELANKATRGIWIAVGRWVENVHDDLPDIVTTTEDRGPNDSDKQQCADAAYIAAVSPPAVKRLIDEIRSLRAVVQAGAVPLTCEWTHNADDSFWDTECGQSWRFDDGGPKENHMNFCHCCGKTLRIKGGQHG